MVLQQRLQAHVSQVALFHILVLQNGLDHPQALALAKDMADPYGSVPLLQFTRAQQEPVVNFPTVHVQAIQEQKFCPTRVTRRG